MIINEFQDANGTPFGVGLPIIKVEMEWILESGMYMGIPDFMTSIMEDSKEPVLISIPEGMDKEGIYILEGTNDPEDYDGVAPKIPYATQVELVDASILAVLFKSQLPIFPEDSVIEKSFLIGLGGGAASLAALEFGSSVPFFTPRILLGALLKVDGEWYLLNMGDQSGS